MDRNIIREKHLIRLWNSTGPAFTQKLQLQDELHCLHHLKKIMKPKSYYVIKTKIKNNDE